MGIWHPRLFAVGVSALLVAILRALSYAESGTPLQVAMQVLMPVPLVIAFVILVPRVRASPRWWIPITGFAVSIPAVLYAWTKHAAANPGDESCAAKGFLPLEWTDPVEETLFFGALGAIVLLLVAGVIMARRPETKWQGYWSLMAAGVAVLEWYAAPVCVGT